MPTPVDDRQLAVLFRRFLTRGGTGANVAIALAAATHVVPLPKTEPDALYGVLVTPSWLTTVRVTGKTTTQFTVDFGTAAPAGATIDFAVIRSE